MQNAEVGSGQGRADPELGDGLLDRVELGLTRAAVGGRVMGQDAAGVVEADHVLPSAVTGQQLIILDIDNFLVKLCAAI